MDYYLRCRVDGKLQLALLAILDRQALHEQRAEAAASTTAERVKHEKTLQALAVLCLQPYCLNFVLPLSVPACECARELGR